MLKCVVAKWQAYTEYLKNEQFLTPEKQLEHCMTTNSQVQGGL